MTGGGSGGHITPILAVARELKRLRPDVKIVYISHIGDQFDDIPAGDPNIDEIHHVYAGKFRRYHGAGWRQLLDFETMLLNLRDACYMVVGTWQSYKKLKQINPGAIMTRGSYVSVPVCLAAAWLRVPYITHDSDAIPGLTNRIIGRWAAVHAVALPEELYPYPIDKTVTVGVPVSPEYVAVTDQLRDQYKRELHLQGYEWVVLVTGGGLGAKSINDAMVANAQSLLTRYPGLAIVHVAGRTHQAEVNAAYDAADLGEARRRVMVEGFIIDMYKYSGAADVVVARGGATNLAELATQEKPCIIIPAAQLTGGHQVKNTETLAKAGAVIQMSDEQIEQELRLGHVISDLLDNPTKTRALAARFAQFARPDSAMRIAEMVLGLAAKRTRKSR